MTRPRIAIATLAAAGLALAPMTTSAAAPRAPSVAEAGEDLAGSGLLYALLVGAAVAIYFIVSADGEDADDLPTSP